MNVKAHYVREARIAEEAALRTLYPAEPFAAGESYVAALELYRQAIHWGLAAHALGDEDREGNSAPTHDSRQGLLPTLESVLTSLPESKLRGWARNDAHLERCTRELRTSNYAVYAALDKSQQQALCEDFRAFSRAVIAPLVPLQRATEMALLKRNLRLLAIAALALGLALGVWRSYRWYKLGTDLALEANWSTSSTYDSALGCGSPLQDCKQAKGFFFHTRQENKPWLMLDFTVEKRFSSVEVTNRQDCCKERANPLTVSVSTDGKTWDVVAERKTEFGTFTASFPEVSARYVKLEVPKPASMLHLSRVRVFP